MMVAKDIRTDDIINGLGAGISVIDRDMRIVWINQLQAEWFGLPETICGKHCYEAYKGARKVCNNCPTVKVFKTGKPHTGVSIVHGKDGQTRSFFLAVSPIRNKDDEVVFAVGLVQDISDRLNRQRQSRVVSGKLKRMLSHFSSVNKRLRSNMRRLQGIASNMNSFREKLQKKYHKKINELGQMKIELENIFKVHHAVSSTIDSRKVSSLITRQTCELMRADACIFRLLDAHSKNLVIQASFGISEKMLKETFVVKLFDSLSGKVAVSKKPLWIQNISENPRIFCHPDVLKQEGFTSIYYMPVIFRRETLGVLSIYSRKERKFSNDEIEVLKIFASQVSMALHESRSYENVYMNYFNTIHALMLAMEARDSYTSGHTERVTTYAMQLARMLKLSNEELEILRYASEVHDVGKIGIPDSILNKPGKLNPSERAIIELHPVKGAQMLEPLDFLKSAIPVVRHHHERYDGTGYPDKLAKDKIPILSRIISCADAYDAMTSERSYRKHKLSTEEALQEIRNNAGTQFDPHIAGLFVKAMKFQNLSKN